MPEIDPPPLGSWRVVALIEGPLIEEIGEFLGRVVPVSRGVDAIGRVLPFPWLQRLFKRTREATDQQQKEDGKRVIKVHTAIQIVVDNLNGLAGTVNELADLLKDFNLINPEKRFSVVDKIADELRKHALGQNKKKYILKRPPNKQGPNKGFASDWTRRKVGDHHHHPIVQDVDYPAPLPKDRS